MAYPDDLDTWQNPLDADALSTSPDGRDHQQHHADLNDAVQALEVKAGIDDSADATSHQFKLDKRTHPNVVVADAFDSASESLIHDCESTSGGSPVSGTWVVTNGGGPTLDGSFFTQGAKSIKAGSLKAGWDNNPNSTSNFYVNLASDQSRGTYTAIALDINFDFVGTADFEIGDAFELFASDGASISGNVVTARFPVIPSNTSDSDRTVYIPVASLSSVRCIGMRTRALVQDEIDAKADIHIDNIRWATQTELEAALGQAETQAVVIPPAYTPSETQQPLMLEDSQSVLDLRPSNAVLANAGGVKHIRQFHVPEDGVTDVSQVIQDVFNSLVEGDHLEFSGDGVYNVTEKRIRINDLTGVTINGNGARFYMTDERDSPMFSLRQVHRSTFRNLRGFGQKPETVLGSAFVTVTGSPTIVGDTVTLDAQQETVRMSGNNYHSRDKDGNVCFDLTLSDSAQVASDCAVEIKSANAPSTPPTLSQVGTEGPVPAGVHYYRYSYVDAEGKESSPSESTAITMATPGKVDVTITAGTANLTEGPPIVARRIYRTMSGLSDDIRNYQMVETVDDNTTLVYRDVSVDDTGGNPSGTMTFTNLGAGNVDAGAHIWRVTYIKTDGTETQLGGTLGAQTLVSASQVRIGNIPVGGASVTKRRIYRNRANDTNAGHNFRYVGEIADNTTTTFDDNIADSSLGDRVPDQLGASPSGTMYQRFLTLTNTPTTYEIREPITGDLLRQHMFLRVRKVTATTNTITVSSGAQYGRVNFSGGFENNGMFQTDNVCTDLLIENCWGEGMSGDFFVGGQQGNRRITIRDCVSWGFRRQGMSLTRGTDYIVERCKIVAPGRSGIDIEPFSEGWFAIGVRLRGLEFFDIENYCIAAENWWRIIDMSIEDCKMVGGHAATDGFMSGGARGLRVKDIHSPFFATFTKGVNCVIDGVVTSKFRLFNATSNSLYAITTSGSYVNNIHTTGWEAVPFDAEPTDTVVGWVHDKTLGVLSTQPMLMKAGAVSDSDFPYPQNGLMGLDTTNHRLYVREGGTWRYATLT